MLAAQALAAAVPVRNGRPAKKTVLAAVEAVAKRLGNTRSVCRKCYIHPAILDAYMDGATIATVRRQAARLARAGLQSDEAAVVSLIQRRLRTHQAAPRSAPGPRRIPSSTISAPRTSAA